MSAIQPNQPDPSVEELDPQLAALVGAILDGGTLDWSSFTDSASASFRDELRIVADVAGVHRSLTEVAPDATPFPSRLPWDAGPLTITASLGRGAFGEVFRAWDTQLQRDVALKLLFRDRGHEAEGDRFLEEGRLLAKVRHPNVVTVHGAERLDGRVGLITEFVDGRTLSDIVRESGPLPAGEVLSIGLDLCRALSAVHDAGLIHRDIKPQNVMRQRDGRIVLMDFGAGHWGEAVAQALAGTPLFLAPEVLNDAPATVQSDVYSLGVLLHYLTTGSYPISGSSLADIRRNHSAGARTLVRTARPDFPRRLAQAIDGATDPEPARRYATAQTFGTALSKARAPWSRAGRAAALAALLVIAGAGTWTVWHSVAPSGRHVDFQSRGLVLVADFENDTGERQFDRTLHHAVTHELSNSTHLTVVPRERIADALRLMATPEDAVVDASLAREVARRDGGIRIVVAGRVEKLAGRYLLTAQLIDPGSGATLESRREEARTEADVRRAVRMIANWIRQALGESAGRIQQSTQQLERVTTPSPQAVRLYSEAFDAGARGRWAEAEELVRAALDHDPEFASAHIWLAWSMRNSGKKADQYLPPAQRAFELAATTGERERYFIRGSYYTLLGDDARSLPAYEALLRLYPDHYWGLRNLQAASVRLGRPRAEIASLVTRMAAARPNDFHVHVQAAQIISAAGGIEPARPYIERARGLLPSVKPSGAGPPNITWLKWFGVHDLWVQRRFPEAGGELAALEAQGRVQEDGDWGIFLRASLHLTLGRNAHASALFDQAIAPNMRAMGLALAAYAREDQLALRAHGRAYAGDDLAAVSLLIRAGDLEGARGLFGRMSHPQGDSDWTAAELAVAGGGAGKELETLQAGVRALREGTGVRALFYSLTLADGFIKAGDLEAATEVLEETGRRRDRLYGSVGANGYLWMRTQKRLAELYRRTGRLREAHAIESELLSALANADPDHPMLIALRKLGR